MHAESVKKTLRAQKKAASQRDTALMVKYKSLNGIILGKAFNLKKSVSRKARKERKVKSDS